MFFSGDTQPMNQSEHELMAEFAAFENRRETQSADLDARLEAEAERRVPQELVGVERSEAVADVKDSLDRVMRL